MSRVEYSESSSIFNWWQCSLSFTRLTHDDAVDVACTTLAINNKHFTNVLAVHNTTRNCL